MNVRRIGGSVLRDLLASIGGVIVAVLVAVAILASMGLKPLFTKIISLVLGG